MAGIDDILSTIPLDQLAGRLGVDEATAQQAVGAALPALLGGLQEQRSLAVTIYDRGVVQNDYGLASAMGVVLLAIAFVVTYFSLRYSRGALAE